MMVDLSFHHDRFACFQTKASCLLLMATVSLFLGCAPPATPEPEEGTTDVFMQGIAFVPKEVTIKVGERVRWTNRESFPIVHTTTSGDPSDGNAGDLWDSGNLSPGESFVRQFDEAGEFEYFCIPHQNMQAMRRAKVLVTP